MHSSDKRSFDRYPIDFAVTVSLQDHSGELMRETTSICDISGNGLRFSTYHPDRYFVDQELDISIALPDTDQMNPNMTARGQVVRIDTPDDSQKNINHEVSAILLTPLRFAMLG